jgi:hypothetical protein
MRSLFASIALVTLCASSLAATPEQRVDLALKRIDVAVEAYGKAHPTRRYPRSLRELSRFAASIGRPLDLSLFSSITLEHPRPTFMSISYQSSVPSRVAGVLAYSTVY